MINVIEAQIISASRAIDLSKGREGKIRVIRGGLIPSDRSIRINVVAVAGAVEEVVGVALRVVVPLKGIIALNLSSRPYPQDIITPLVTPFKTSGTQGIGPF